MNKMREIKFRAWDKEDQEMIEDFGRTNLWELSGGDDNDDYAVMQFTGLKDKNGVDIYEGDVVQKVDLFQDVQKTLVEYTTEDAGFVPFAQGFFPTDHVYSWDPKECVILGNIYENPELIA